MKECNIPLTIERQLKSYSECPEHIERHEVLWHEWNHNKRWLIQVQQLVLPSFPSYSRHDVSHSEAVLHNIEMILGEENIKKLSATDCFVLLHTVYIHDIGMCITYEERSQILKNGKFHEYLQRLLENGNTDMSYYASILLRECFKKEPSKSDHVNIEEQRQYILDKKLEVYYAITYLIAEFRRKEHGDISKKRLEEWIDNPDKLGVGFSTIEIPDRLFYIIANCAATHTKWNFKEVLNLNQEDSGFVLDYVHPRFIAVLLQLGDALDMDNDRFHPLTREYLGTIPKMSEIHYRKHKAIRRLRITNEKISISANCQTQDELRLIRSECDGIEDILKNATFYWSVIKPKKSNMCLPTLDKTELLLDGKQIPVELVKAQFEIPQEKAFELLKGNNIYTEEHFVFLRELIQNAVDATKIQYFRDYRRNLKRTGEEEKRTFSNPVTIGKKNDPLRYPIDIELSMKKCKGTEYEDISEEDLKNPEERLAEYECGVLVKITDYATGISKEDIEQIANVGSSYPSKEKEIKEMPTWLRPTGTFGIGLQSVFLSAKVLKATTHALTGEPYEIVFHPRHEGEAGYINVTPRNIDVNTEPFGSCFEVFVPYFKKKMHHENPETWDGTDPFEENYEKTRPIRHTRELMKQMALYIGDLVGEALFPINLTLRDCDSCDVKKKENLYDEAFRKRFSNVSLSIYFKYTEKCEKFYLENSDSNVTWAYKLGKKDEIIHEDDNGDIYRLDCDRAELCIWNQKYSAYACVGINRIWNMRRRYNMPEIEKLDEGIKIFYKGIQVTHTSFDEDANLIEYIDLKETLKKEYLKLNRKGFSQEGYEYLGEIYHDIIKTARKALNYFGTSTKEGECKYEYLEKINNKIRTLLDDEEDRKTEKTEKIILSATALVYFAMLNEQEPFCGSLGEQGQSGWNWLLDQIISMRRKMEGERFKSTLYHIPLWRKNDEENSIKRDGTRSIMEIIYSENKYAVLSERDEKKHQWVMYLIGVNDSYQEIKSKVSELKSTTEWSKRRKLIGDIDKEGQNILEKSLSKEMGTEDCGDTKDTYSEEKNVEFLKIQKEQMILKWIVSNIPTMAIFTSKDGNRRLNLLDVDISNSAYYDLNMKNLVIERIIELSNKAKRFSVPAWSGYEYICFEKMRKSIKFVIRGKMSEMSYHEMIFPFTGVQLQKIMDDCKNQIEKQEEEIKKICDSVVFQILSRVDVGESGVKLRERYWQTVERKIADSDITWDEKWVFRDITEDEYTQIIEFLKDEKYDAEKIWNEKLIPGLRKLKKLWKEYDEILEKYEYNQGREAYNKYCKNQVQYTILNEYVQKNGKMKPSLNQINTLYFLYICEIMQVLMNKNGKEKMFIEQLKGNVPENNWEEMMQFIFC